MSVDPGSPNDEPLLGLFDNLPPVDAPLDPEAELKLAEMRRRLFGVDIEPICIGRFELLRRIDHGGMGTVYLAQDPRLKRRVALKLLHTAGNTPEEHQRTQAAICREAEAMAKLDHPNVVEIYEVGVHQDQVFLAMAYVEGQTLRQWQHNQTWRDILAVYLQAAAGLAAAHARGVVHGDFKPDNVLVGVDGRVRLLDFGLARLVPELGPSGEENAATNPGGIVGTPDYLAPEQLDGGPATPRADQFALCTSLYEALHRKYPYARHTYGELASTIRSGDPTVSEVVVFLRYLSDLRGAMAERRIYPPIAAPAIPRWLRNALLRGLDPDPSRRFPDIEALRRELMPRPHMIRAQTAMAAGVLLVVGASFGGVALVELQQEAACREPIPAIDAPWDPDALAARLQPSGAPDPAVARFIEIAGDYHRALQREQFLWCDATSFWPDAAQARRLEDQRACLARRSRQFSAVLDAVTSGTAALSIAALDDLDPPQECDDPPIDRDVVAASTTSSDALDRSFARESLGDFVTARDLAAQAITAGQDTGDRAYLAQAYLAYGRTTAKLYLYEDSSDPNAPTAAMTAIQQAVLLAGAMGYENLHASAWSFEVSAASSLASAGGVTFPILVSAEELRQRVGDDLSNRRQAELATAAGLQRRAASLKDGISAAERTTALMDAVSAFTNALKYRDADVTPDLLERAKLLTHLGDVHLELGDADTAARTLAQADALWSQLQGKPSLYRIELFAKLARSYRTAGDDARADELFREARRLAETTEGFQAARARTLQLVADDLTARAQLEPACDVLARARRLSTTPRTRLQLAVLEAQNLLTLAEQDGPARDAQLLRAGTAIADAEATLATMPNASEDDRWDLGTTAAAVHLARNDLAAADAAVRPLVDSTIHLDAPLDRFTALDLAIQVELARRDRPAATRRIEEAENTLAAFTPEPAQLAEKAEYLDLLTKYRRQADALPRSPRK